LKNLCIFHQFEKSSHFSRLWKIFVFFTTSKNFLHRVGHPWQFDHRKIFEFSKTLPVFTPSVLSSPQEDSSFLN
jgi:hypothetical protein